jgi:hypothetical protein
MMNRGEQLRRCVDVRLAYHFDHGCLVLILCHHLRMHLPVDRVETWCIRQPPQAESSVLFGGTFAYARFPYWVSSTD